MARKVFFSFYYDRDVFRVSQIRNSNVVTSQYQASQFLDHADWERSKDRAMDIETLGNGSKPPYSSSKTSTIFMVLKSVKLKFTIGGLQTDN